MMEARVLCDERDHRWKKVGELNWGYNKQDLLQCQNPTCRLERYVPRR